MHGVGIVGHYVGRSSHIKGEFVISVGQHEFMNVSSLKTELSKNACFVP